MGAIVAGANVMEPLQQLAWWKYNYAKSLSPPWSKRKDLYRHILLVRSPTCSWALSESNAGRACIIIIIIIVIISIIIIIIIITIMLW